MILVCVYVHALCCDYCNPLMYMYRSSKKTAASPLVANDNVLNSSTHHSSHSEESDDSVVGEHSPFVKHTTTRRRCVRTCVCNLCGNPLPHCTCGLDSLWEPFTFLWEPFTALWEPFTSLWEPFTSCIVLWDPLPLKIFFSLHRHIKALQLQYSDEEEELEVKEKVVENSVLVS